MLCLAGAALVCLAAPPAAAQEEMLGMLLGAPGAPGELTLGYEQEGYRPAEPADGGAEATQTREEGRLGWLALSGPGGQLRFSLKAGTRHLTSDAPLSAEGRPLPDRLSEREAGLAFSRTLAHGGAWGASLTVGSASDAPSQNDDVLNDRVLLFLRRPAGGNDAWVYLLLFNSDGSLGVRGLPIPTFAYIHRPSRETLVVAGLPFLYARTLAGRWVALQALYFPLKNALARADVLLAPGARLFASARVFQKTYQLADRVDEEENLVYEERRDTLGLRLGRRGASSLSLEVSRVSQAKLFYGEHGLDPNETLALEETQAYAAILRLRF